ncbi:hypothetical protein C0Z18_27060 [Trinickia dabaoshanensis]|uniref:Uncharacterized protein n=1 Tax=Trinickia dabaoshanensis TaxID=564714 RepID=A0A2N7VEB9_9BURK|nr:hypothetical protein C0Z18_27060 [Trinickia dabaoshanensis]
MAAAPPQYAADFEAVVGDWRMSCSKRSDFVSTHDVENEERARYAKRRVCAGGPGGAFRACGNVNA